MKKKIIGLAFTIAVVSALSTAAYASTYVNNEDVTSSVFTSSSNGYTLFPVRYLGEKLGCDVYWNPDDKCITVSKDDIHRDFYNGSAAVYDWAGNSYNLVTAPKFVDGNTNGTSRILSRPIRHKRYMGRCDKQFVHKFGRYI